MYKALLGEGRLLAAQQDRREDPSPVRPTIGHPPLNNIRRPQISNCGEMKNGKRKTTAAYWSGAVDSGGQRYG
jgi:hypothetical protein